MIRLTSQSETLLSEGDARYFLAQYMPDVMRRELFNIGVVVDKGGKRAARFVGQQHPGAKIDGRALKQLSDPRIYRMWVRHWEKVLAQEDWQEKLVSEGTVAYSFIQGGDVSDTGGDSAEEICSHLFSLLVSSGGLSEALQEEEEEEAIVIKKDIMAELRKLELMKSNAQEWCKHPVYENKDLKGASGWQRISLLQESGNDVWAIEPLNLTSKSRWQLRERGGYLAYLFRDIKAAGGKSVNPIAVIRVGEEDRADKNVEYALNAVENEADIVDWNDTKQRKQFLNDRETAARSAA